MRRQVASLILALTGAACGQPISTEAPPLASRSAHGGWNEVLRGRSIRVTAGPVHPEFPSIEVFMCDGRWFTSGAGHSDRSGTYEFDGDLLCIATASRESFCRRVERVSDSAVRLHVVPQSSAMPFQYAISDEPGEHCEGT